MPHLLVRPYPVERLVQASAALRAALEGDVRPMRALYVAARDALEDLDPDEVHDPVLRHRTAGDLDKAALRAALDLSDAWEGVVAVGSIITSDSRFRAFAWAAAAARHLDLPALEPAMFSAWGRGAPLPGLSLDDTALYAILPALTGLGPELPDEIEGPCPVPGDPAWKILGLPEADWDGVDPLDGVALTPEACAGAYPTANGPWKDVLARGAAAGGLLVREDTLGEDLG